MWVRKNPIIRFDLSGELRGSPPQDLGGWGLAILLDFRFRDGVRINIRHS